MKLKAIKKLQLITVLIFFLTILITITALILIGISNFSYNNYEQIKITNGFNILKIYSTYFILCHCANHICLFHIFQNNHNYYNWIQLQIGVILLIIVMPIFIFIIITLTFFIIGLKRKIKNNNFWDAIANCEIISNYYIH
ncbi:hypothetical protein [Spiroplasma ixodetis]|uniref:Transmembrane protein n=1 Tax=Spiroplasma ixodetis TaxID=2141 RepID=A0ABM8JNF9_9MOLU